MAILKYDQVTAPDFTGVSSILKGASNSFNSAGTYANKAIEDFLKSRQDMAEYQLRSRLNSLTPEQYANAGRSFLNDLANQENLRRLNIDAYKALATDSVNRKNTLLNEYTSNLYSELQKQARNEGYLSVPSLMSNDSRANWFENLPLEEQQKLIAIDSSLSNYRLDPNYQKLDGKEAVLTEFEKTKQAQPQQQEQQLKNIPSNQARVTRIIQNNLDKASKETTPTLDLSEFSQEDTDIAKKAIADFGYKSLDDLDNQKFMTTFPYKNPLKYNNNAYKVAQAILKYQDDLAKAKSFDVRSSNTRRYESGNAGLATVNTKDTGGYAYGDFQIHSNTMPAFAQYVLSKDPTLGSVLSSLSAWDTEAGEKTWKALANNPKAKDKLKKYQDEFIQKEFYDRPYNALSNIEKQALENDPGLKEVFFDTMNNHGMTRGLPIFRNAFTNAKNTDDVIRNLGYARQDKYTSSTPLVRQNAQERVNTTTRDALAISTKAPINSINNLTQSVRNSIEQTSKTPIRITAQALLDPSSKASSFLNNKVKSINNAITQKQQQFEKEFKRYGVSSKDIANMYNPDSPTGFEAAKSTIDNVISTLLGKVSGEDNQKNERVLRQKIANMLTIGQEYGIPPKVMEGMILANTDETRFLWELATEETTKLRVEDKENIGKLAQNLKILTDSYNVYSAEKSKLDQASKAYTDLLTNVQKARENYNNYSSRGLTGAARVESQKLNNILDNFNKSTRAIRSNI